MLKAITVALLVLNTITYTTYGVLANAKDEDAADNAVERYELVSSRNRRGLSAGMKPVINVYSSYVCSYYACSYISAFFVTWLHSHVRS